MVVDPGRKSISELMGGIEAGEYRIPSFQRSFVWKPKAIVSLLDSIFHDYPTGSLLLLQNNNKFSSDPIKGAPDISQDCDYLILDGQQRLTSCYQVFYDKGSNRYFIDLDKLYTQYVSSKSKGRYDADDLDFAQCVTYFSSNKKAPESIVDKRLPFTYLKDRLLFEDIKRAYVKTCEISGGESQEFIDFVDMRLTVLLNPFFEYNFITTTISNKMSTSAVCRVFETLNNTGTKLDSFDICVAVFMRDGRNLKKDLDAAIEKSPVLSMFFGPDRNKNREIPLQIIALASDIEKTQKNKLAETLKINHLEKNWDNSLKALEKTLEILDGVGANTTKTLAYLPYLVSVTVISAALIKSGIIGGKVSKEISNSVDDNVHKYFFYSALTARYGDGVPAKMKEDSKELTTWITNSTVPERYKDGVGWDARELAKLSKGNSGAIANAIRCAMLDKHPQDPRKKTPIDASSEEIDIHHIFPLDRYKNLENIDSLFNTAFILSATNRSIGSNNTWFYKDKIIGDSHLSETQFKVLLESHYIDDDAYDYFVNEKLDDFIFKRMDLIRQHIENKFGIKIRQLTDITGQDDVCKDIADNEDVQMPR